MPTTKVEANKQDHLKDTPKVSPFSIYVGPRMRREMGDIIQLAKDIDEDGLIHPIAIRPVNEEDKAEKDYEGQPYALVAGGRRFAAMVKLRWREIPVHIREDMTTLKARVLELHENIHRKPMTWQEEVAAKEEILRLRQEEDPEITQEEVAAELGISNATLSRDIKTAQAVRENPQLAKAQTKHAALRASEVAKRAKLKSDATEREKRMIRTIEDRVVTADMVEWLPTLERGSVDLMCADLPYGIDYFKSGQKIRTVGKDSSIGIEEFDDTLRSTAALYNDIVPSLVRATRETGWIVCFTGAELYPYLQGLFEDTCFVHASYRREGLTDRGHRHNRCEAAEDDGASDCRFLVAEPVPWIWYRPNSRNSPRYPEFHAQNQYERILVVNMGKGILYGQLPAPNVLVHDAEYHGDRTHANEKPLSLYQDLIKRLTQEGDLVVDPCYGSGKCLAAASSLMREFFGADKNPALRSIALGKVATHYAPLTDTVKERALKQRKARALSDVDAGVYDFGEVEDE